MFTPHILFAKVKVYGQSKNGIGNEKKQFPPTD
jgi:hypothetical protein